MYLHCFWHFQHLFKKNKNSKIYFQRVQFLMRSFQNYRFIFLLKSMLTLPFKKNKNYLDKGSKSANKKKMRNQSDFGLLKFA